MNIFDREHNAIRFLNGKPQSIWYSQHNYGRAYTFSAVQKSANNRPIAYSARGSHANYADPDSHDLHDLSMSPLNFFFSARNLLSTPFQSLIPLPRPRHSLPRRLRLHLPRSLVGSYPLSLFLRLLCRNQRVRSAAKKQKDTC